MDPASCINDILKYVFENERPDMSEMIEYFSKEFFGGGAADKRVNQRIWWPGSNEAMAQWVYNNWNPQKNDVVIASFPKTGTTWVSSIVNRIMYKDDEYVRKMFEEMTMPVVYLETGMPKKIELLEKLPWRQKILSTHLPVELVNTEKIKAAGAKIIYTMRNPKDVTVSFFCMKKSIKQKIGDWDEFFESFTLGKVGLSMKDGEWLPDHMLGWHKHRNDESVLFVVYENLITNPQKEIQRIADFLEVSLSDEELSNIVKATSFEEMKANAIDWHKQLNFFRKGKIGSWKSYFTVAQSELMDQKLREKFSSTDISFTYE